MSNRQMCGCHGAIHNVIDNGEYALSCQNCGNIPCVLQGQGPCLFCGSPDYQFRPEIEGVGSKAFFEEQNKNKGPLKFFKADCSHQVMNEQDEAAALQFQQMIYRNVEVVVDPDQAVKDDQLVLYDYE